MTPDEALPSLVLVVACAAPLFLLFAASLLDWMGRAQERRLEVIYWRAARREATAAAAVADEREGGTP